MKRRDQEQSSQPTLWGEAIDSAIATQPKLARDRDPETSQSSAEQILQSLPEIQRAMYRVFHFYGAMTANEAAALCVAADCRHNQESYRKRAGELERKGLLVIESKRLCTNVKTPTPVSVYRIKPAPADQERRG